jgi:hypothetical protein
MQEYFMCDPGHEDEASVVQDRVCQDRLKDMFYEAHVQCLISYHANVLKEKLDKTDARKMIQWPKTDMPREAYMLVSRKQ